MLGHGLLVVAFSSSAVCFSALLRGTAALPSWRSFLVAFATSFLAFLHLRIADEFKDIDEDSRYRPYRPVPRGLVSLRELGVVAVIGVGIQAALAVWLQPRLLPLLLVTWLYLALMSREFFAREWLKARPFTYMWTHMLIMPLIDFYATACDWSVAAGAPPSGLFLFVAVSFFNGMVIEIGRKIRAPEQEETGVETYTFLWGRGRATGFWLGVMAASGAVACWAGVRIGFAIPIGVVLGCVWLVCLWRVVGFLRKPEPARADWFESLAGVWTLCLYLMLGIVPMAARMFQWIS